MGKMAAELRRKLAAHPSSRFDLILHVDGSMGDIRAQLDSMGVDVRRSFRLTHTVSVRCTGRKALALARKPWVTRIEADRRVRAFGR